MPDLTDAIKDELVGEPSAARAIKLLDYALEQGWTENPFASFTIRLTREDGLPFYATWHLSANPETGKRSWRFAKAFASNSQPLAFNDIKVYLDDPDVIFPEPPTSPEDDTDEAVRTALGSLDPLGPTPVLPSRTGQPAKAAAAKAADGWGALLNG